MQVAPVNLDWLQELAPAYCAEKLDQLQVSSESLQLHKSSDIGCNNQRRHSNSSSTLTVDAQGSKGLHLRKSSDIGCNDQR